MNIDIRKALDEVRDELGPNTDIVFLLGVADAVTIIINLNGYHHARFLMLPEREDMFTPRLQQAIASLKEIQTQIESSKKETL